MVLESLISPADSEKKPFLLFGIGFLNTIVAVLLGAWVFNEIGGIVSVFLAVLMMHVLVFRTMQREEAKSLLESTEKARIGDHLNALRFLLFLFFGSTAAFGISYFLFAESFFSAQLGILQSYASANAVAANGALLPILYNNYKLLLLVLLLGFISCSGGIFILTWNASIIGVTIASLIDKQFALVSSLPLISALSIGIGSSLQVFLHGTFEIAAYFLAGIAGSVISVSVIHRHYCARKFYRVLYDVAHLILIASLLILLSGLIEVYVSPSVSRLV